MTTLIQRSSVVHVVSKVTVTTLTLLTLGTLFCLFLLIGLMDDMILMLSPRLTHFIQRLHQQLCNIAEWEREKRASWGNENSMDNRIQSLISNLAGAMNDYIKSTQ
ncbi:hypothetical protein BY458DRAFT_588150 [Sporodiniella umbellata]|nr:hypothetical protein BY458DRAFT_588150 [Sporodiniella umbellata]